MQEIVRSFFELALVRGVKSVYHSMQERFEAFSEEEKVLFRRELLNLRYEHETRQAVSISVFRKESGLDQLASLGNSLAQVRLKIAHLKQIEARLLQRINEIQGAHTPNKEETRQLARQNKRTMKHATEVARCFCAHFDV